jgi:LysM repeat protein
MIKMAEYTTGIPSVLATTGKATTPVATAITPTPAATSVIPSVLKTQPTVTAVTQIPETTPMPEVEKVPKAVATTGIPEGWNVEDYSKNFQAEIDRIKSVNPNDPRLPILQAARVKKISTMPEYTIKSGDTLSNIAKAHGTTVKELQSINPSITDVNKITAGQAIRVPKAAKVTTTAPVVLGTLSSKYESSGNPGAISTGAGDIGGKSYGTYQLASKMGSVNKFMDYLKTANPEYYNKLYTAYTTGGVGFGNNFDNAWKQLATSDPEGFEKAQHDYIQAQYYDKAAQKLKDAGFDISTKSPALQNVLWSTAVQHGVNGAVNLFKTAGLTGSDSDIINNVYNERSNVNKYFKSSSDAVKQGVKNRFENERKDALKMLSEVPTEAPMEVPTEAPAAGVPEVLKEMKAPTEIEGKTYTNEATEKPWNIEDYRNNYQAEIDRIQSIDATDPRIDVLLKARAEKILADPELSKDPNMSRWANDMLTGVWDIRDYEGDYQAEINKLRAENPADPRIAILESARADKIMANPSEFDQATKDWAINIDKRDWNINDYKNNYQAEIDRIKKFDPNDPRIEELSDARATKILNNPGGYDKNTVDWAEKYSEEHGDRMALRELNQSYLEAEAQSDINTRRAAKAILDYYKSLGLEAGGQAAAAIAQTAMAGKAELGELEKSRAAQASQLVAQQQAAKAEKEVAEAKAAIEQAKTDAALQKAQIDLQKAQLSYEQAQVNLAKAKTSAASAAAKSTSKTSAAPKEAKASAAQYKSYLNYYEEKIVDPSKGFLGIGKKEGNHPEIISEIVNNPYISSAQVDQMLIDLGLYEEAMSLYGG